MRIILASASPRRKELLSNMGVEFDIIVSDVDENVDGKLNCFKKAEAISAKKAKSVFDNESGDRLVIGSDTMVVYKNTIFGKPKDELDAKRMLTLLSGKTHFVVTGLCVLVSKNGVVTEYVTHAKTKVKFKNLSESDIDNYIATGEPMDKAGAYAIQGLSGKFVDEISGNYASVVGLPTNLLFDIFKKENIFK